MHSNITCVVEVAEQGAYMMGIGVDHLPRYLTEPLSSTEYQCLPEERTGPSWKSMQTIWRPSAEGSLRCLQ